MKLKTLFTGITIVTISGVVFVNNFAPNFDILKTENSLYIGNSDKFPVENENIPKQQSEVSNKYVKNEDIESNNRIIDSVTSSVSEVVDTVSDVIIEDKVINLEYSNYSLQFNCNKGGFDYFYYTTVPDPNIDLNRYSNFHANYDAITECGYNEERKALAKNTKTYKSPANKPKYDRGHGVHQNIWDDDKELMKNTNYMTNIVPHQMQQNRQGLWRYLEKLTECKRDQETLFVIGGNIWGDNKENDYFFETHGVETPDDLFKIIKFSNGDIYSWLIPNNPLARAKNADDFLVSVAHIEELSGYDLSGWFNKEERLVIQQNTPVLENSRTCIK